MTSGGRRAGVLVPLFSFPSTTSWGIGEIGDLAPMCAWLAGGGQRVLQLLPLNEMAPGQQSPYSAISAMAIDPIFISVNALQDFAAVGGEQSMPHPDRQELDLVRGSRRVAYGRVRRLKEAALRAAFARFLDEERSRRTGRAIAFEAYVAAEAWWIDDYALFRSLHARAGEQPWTEWSVSLQRRDPEALDRARRELSREILFHQYLQWVADEQWRAARRAAGAIGVQLFGDLPFMVDGDSADVWAGQELFRLDASLGVPPDAFSATGQDWGMPSYRWETMAARDFRWLRDRARRSASLYDGYRVDHLVGFYRTYSRPRDGGNPFFSPAAEPDQTALGQQVLAVFREPGAEIIAEDLGTVPDFVRRSLERLGIPGFKVLRWERDWHAAGQPFLDPASYPALSVAVSGTHDTEPLATWWEGAPAAERTLLGEVPSIRRLTKGATLGDVLDPFVRDTLLETLFASASDLLLLPFQDLFGWRARINTPATVNDENWTVRLPWPVDRLHDQPEAQERQAALRAWTERHRRV